MLIELITTHPPVWQRPHLLASDLLWSCPSSYCKLFLPHERMEWVLGNTSAQSGPKADAAVSCLQSSLTGCWWRLWFEVQREHEGLPQVRSFSFPWRSVKCNALVVFPDGSASEWNVGQDYLYLRQSGIHFLWEVWHPLLPTCLATPSLFPISSSSWDSSSVLTPEMCKLQKSHMTTIARNLSQSNEGARTQHNGLVIQLDAFVWSQGSPICRPQVFVRYFLPSLLIFPETTKDKKAQGVIEWTAS